MLKTYYCNNILVSHTHL